MDEYPEYDFTTAGGGRWNKEEEVEEGGGAGLQPK